MTHVEVIITVENHTMRYEAHVDRLVISESTLTGELAIRPNPDLHPKPKTSKTSYAWGGPLTTENPVWPWQKYLVGDNWTADTPKFRE